MAQHRFNLAKHGKRDESKLSDSAFQFFTANYKTYAASVGERRTPRVERRPRRARLRFGGVIAERRRDLGFARRAGILGVVHSIVLIIMTGAPLPEWLRCSQTSSPINRTVVDHRQASLLRRWWLRVR